MKRPIDPDEMKRGELRDWFAGCALIGGVSSFFASGDAWDSYGDFAKSCYGVADAMMAEGEKEPPSQEADQQALREEATKASHEMRCLFEELGGGNFNIKHAADVLDRCLAALAFAQGQTAWPAEVITEALEDIARDLFSELCEGDGEHSESLDRALILKHLQRVVPLPAPPRADPATSEKE